MIRALTIHAGQLFDRLAERWESTSVRRKVGSLLVLSFLGALLLIECNRLVGSVANSVGKQLEILSLILLRQAFEELSEFGEPVTWAQVSDSILVMLADVLGALLIFVALGSYYRLQRHQPLTDDPDERDT